MKLSLHKKYILIVVLLFGLVSLITFTTSAPTMPHKKEPQVKDGVLDLTEWDLKKDGAINLDGEWEFYWNQLLTYDDFHGKNHTLSGYFPVPNIWNNYIVEDKSLPGYGYGTYRVKIKVNDKVSLKGLKISTMSTAYKLMINDVILAENGIVGSSEATSSPEYKPMIRFFQNASEEFEIIVQVSNFTYARGGIWYSIILGTDQQIVTIKESASRREVFILGAVLMMALYHIPFFSFQRKYKLALYFTLMLVAGMIRTAFHGEYVILSITPSLDIHKLVFFEYMTIHWGCTALLAFLHELYPEESSLRIRNFSIGIVVLLTIMAIVYPINVYTRFILYYEIFWGLIVLYCISVTLTAAIRKKPGATLLAIGTTFFLVIVIYDSLYNWNIVKNSYGGMFPLSIFFLIFVQAFAVAQRFSTAFSEVEKLSNQLISLNERKDEFMANTSHELRTPLHGMINITESVLQSASGTLTHEQQENLSIVVASGKRLATLVNDILDYSKLRNGDIKLNKKTIAIHPVIMVVFDITKYLAATKPIIFKSDIPNHLPAIYADEDRFVQIIYNLLGNAIKFTENGQITLSAHINKDMIEISVEDTGIGIPQGKLEDIFKSFEQVDTSLIREYGGTGLGLSITKYLVEIHNGKITVDSTLGKGSKFTVSMPISSEQQPSIQHKVGLKNVPSSELQQQFFNTPAVFEQTGEFTILIVDDDYVNLQVLINTLLAEKHSIIAVTNGMEALNVLSHNKKIDLVILDIMLPKMSGYEVCQILRKEYSLSDLPVLMLTAQNSPAGILTGFEAGANDFLTKPFDTSELKARVKTLLQLKKSVSQAIHVEMAFLQAQIKPHFLYNALNTIVSFCWTEPEKAGDLLLELSNYLRGSFNFSNMNQFVSIEKELEFVQSYIAIEKARFEEKLSCHYDLNVPLDFMVPTLILQPIVENAVKHGLLPKAEGGIIKISIDPQDEGILITVEDDGVGIPPTKLATLLTENFSHESVGLQNINKRMKRIYGYGIEIVSNLQMGTRVSIQIPYERK